MEPYFPALSLIGSLAPGGGGREKEGENGNLKRRRHDWKGKGGGGVAARRNHQTGSNYFESSGGISGYFGRKWSGKKSYLLPHLIRVRRACSSERRKRRCCLATSRH